MGKSGPDDLDEVCCSLGDFVFDDGNLTVGAIVGAIVGVIVGAILGTILGDIPGGIYFTVGAGIGGGVGGGNIADIINNGWWPGPPITKSWPPES